MKTLADAFEHTLQDVYYAEHAITKALPKVIEAVSNPVNFALWAASAGFGDETIPTRITCSMNVEERNAIAFVESSAFDIEQLTANLLQTSDRDVSGN